MKKRKLIFILIVIVLVINITIFSSCSLNYMPFNSVKYFDTFINYNALYDSKISNDEVIKVWNLMCNEFDRLDSLFDVYNENSDIYKFNTLQPGEILNIDKDTYQLLNIAKDVYDLTNGAFNPSMYLLSDLWGFTERFHNEYVIEKPYDRLLYKEELPNEEYIQGFLSLTNFKDVELYVENNEYYIRKPDNFIIIDGITYSMNLDISAIAKGYISAKALNISKDNGINYGYINIGSSSIVLMNKENNKNWEVSLKNPRGNDNYFKIYLKTSFVSTSGDYEQYYEINNKRYCHIINPLTGYPIDSNIISVTINKEYDLSMDVNSLEKIGAYSDALSTAVMCMNINDAINFINTLDYDALFVYNDNNLKIYSNISYEKTNNKVLLPNDFELVGNGTK